MALKKAVVVCRVKGEGLREMGGARSLQGSAKEFKIDALHSQQTDDRQL